MPIYNNYVCIADLYGLREAFASVPNAVPNADMVNTVHEAARSFADVVISEVPTSYERDRAIQSLREAVLWAHSAIALRSRSKVETE
jgi:hypothetical protein